MTKKKKKRKKRVPNGAIQLQENGKYFGRVPMGNTGERYVYKRVSGKSKEEVKRNILQLKTKYALADITEESLMPLRDWMEYWLEEIKRPMLGITTYGNYRSFIDKHINPLMGSKKLIHISREDIIRFIEKLQRGYLSNKEKKTVKHLAYSSIHEIYCVLAAALKSAAGAGFIPENPCRKMKLPKAPKKPVPILLSEQIYAFLQVLENDNFWYTLFYIELMTGLRSGELCGLKWEDFDVNTGELIIHRSIKYYAGNLVETGTKTNAGRRTIVLSPSVQDLLNTRKSISTSEWIFNAPEDEAMPLNPSLITKHLKRFLKEANIEYIRFHNLRHTFANQAISHGVEDETLSVLMGHVDSTFTLNTYTHNSVDISKNAVGYMDIILDNVLEV